MFEVIGHSRYYSRNEDLIHVTILESRLMDLFLGFVYKHYTSQYSYRKNPEKYKICQFVHPVNPSTIIELNEKTRFYKQSRFSYIIPVDGVTRLKVYNCSNITRCMILFTGDTLHARVSIFETRNGSYPSYLRIFSYIVEDDFLNNNENFTSIKGNMLCTNC